MITIRKMSELSAADKERITKRSGEIMGDVIDRVKEIMEDVRGNGDQALKKYTKMFDKCDLYDLLVSREEIEESYEQVSQAFIDGMKQAMENSRRFEIRTNVVETKTVTEEGIEVWREWRPIEKVGLYIPGGKARYPSCLAMTAVPAKIAGCKEFVVCTPPDEKGKGPAATLVACDLAGVDKIYKVGGAQAVAAMSYGTETIPQVYKIFGAGNVYVTAAKMLAFGTVDIDLPAGPSEIMILADETADPSFLAADLLSQAEHDVAAAAVMVTDSLALAQKTREQLQRQAAKLASFETIKQSLENFGMILVVDSIEEGVSYINEYAPEHLEIVTREDEKYLSQICNVGSVFLGSYSTESAGDYASGSNHVLPTNGYAKMFSPLSTESFGRKIQVQRVTKEGLGRIRNAIAAIADEEGLPAHKNASEVRFTSPCQTLKRFNIPLLKGEGAS